MLVDISLVTVPAVDVTAKPLPGSPTRASIVALSASRLIWPVMLLMRSTMPPIDWAADASLRACASAVATRSTVPLVTRHFVYYNGRKILHT
jgi:hypothetical protein